MNILIDTLPESVNIGGAEFQINWDFRTSILFELLMQDNDVSDEDKIRTALSLFYPVIPGDIEQAIQKILWFYLCGKESTGRKTGNAGGNGKGNRVYSFEHDDSYIFAAFLSQYGIDLNEVEGLHWWKFMAMFKALDENSEFAKIMGYRSIKISKSMSKGQREFYSRMKKIHALPIPRSEQEKNDAITYALMHGGDLTGLLEMEEPDDG